MILRVLFLSHCPSENTAELRDAALGGIESLNLEGIEVISKSPLEADSGDVEACDGIIIGTTENFGAMAGLKKVFDETCHSTEIFGCPYDYSVTSFHVA